MNRSKLFIAFTAVLLGIFSAAASAQSLLDNEFYKKAKDLLAQSDQAMQAGDYDTAASLAAQAKDNLAKSDDYVATMLQFYRANGYLSQANDRIAYAKSIKADTTYAKSYAKAVVSAQAAKAALDAKDYQKSIDLSKSVLDALANIAPPTQVAQAPVAAPAGPPPLPQTYVVRLILPLRDCFWRIAGYPWVYNNPWKWRLLYNANKSVIPDPNNPDLIEVGNVLVIPPLAGETREGQYDPEKTYSTIGSK